MTTKAKEALATRIRGVLTARTALDPDVVAALAEAAILLEVQCEEQRFLFDMLPILIERLVPKRDAGIHALDHANVEEVQIFRALIEDGKRKGADTAPKLFVLLQAGGVAPDLCVWIVNCATDLGYLDGGDERKVAVGYASANAGNGCG